MAVTLDDLAAKGKRKYRAKIPGMRFNHPFFYSVVQLVIP